MHIIKYFREEDREKILSFLHENDFATLVAYDGEKPVASHLLMEVAEADEHLWVRGHMSRANPLWKLFDRNPEVLVIFQGPHTYVSPTWYNHINVPTWNYQSVHLYGRASLITDKTDSYAILKRLIDRYETGTSYSLETLPQDFVEKEIRGVAAFQIEVTQIEANYKLSQNRDEESYRSIVEHLDQRADDGSRAIAEAMRRNRSQ